MGNGEQYIWKPPEDDEVLMLQNKALVPLGAHTVENIQPSATAVSKESSVRASTCPLFSVFLFLMSPSSFNIRQNICTICFMAFTFCIYLTQHSCDSSTDLIQLQFVPPMFSITISFKSQSYGL